MKMSRTKSMLALASGAVFVGSAAQASVTPAPSLLLLAPPYTGTVGAGVTATNLGGAATDDPSLTSGWCTYDIQVIVSSATGQDRWASGDLRAKLAPGGVFYIPPAGDSNGLQIPAVRNATGSRYLQVDTFVDVPIFNATRTTILGKSTFAPASQQGTVFPSNGANFPDANDPNGTAFEPANDMTLVDVAWGDVNAASQTAGSNGTFTIARLTVKVGSTGTFIGRVGSTGAPSSPVSFTYILGIPEPTSVALMGLGLGAVAMRRRK
jgi:hypothetical protein